MSINIQRVIEQLLSTDDSFSAKNQKNIIMIYSKLSCAERRNLDSLFIELCGYSMETIINELNTDTSRKKLSEVAL